MRRLAIALVAAISACTLTSSTAAADVGDEWGKRADQAITRAIALDTGKGNAFHYAFLASAIGHRAGWDDPRARSYLTKALSLGYGTGVAWDPFSDGTVNPANTTYTVTLAGHVGPVVLEAWQAGVVPYSTLTGLLDVLYRTPKIPGVPIGYCMAYSHHPNDVKTGHCVHNVSAGVAAFLQQVEDAGVAYRAGDSRWWRQAITRYEVATYRPVERSWRYVDFRTGLNDADHNAYSIESAMVYAPGIGESALNYWMTRSMGLRSWLGHLLLADEDCANSARWLGEYDAEIGDEPFNRQAQAARYAAMAAAAC